MSKLFKYGAVAIFVVMLAIIAVPVSATSIVQSNTAEIGSSNGITQVGANLAVGSGNDGNTAITQGNALYTTNSQTVTQIGVNGVLDSIGTINQGTTLSTQNGSNGITQVGANVGIESNGQLTQTNLGIVDDSYNSVQGIGSVNDPTLTYNLNGLIVSGEN